MKRLQPRAWMLLTIGCCLIVSWLLSYTGTVVRLETGFYQQLLELTPAFNVAVNIEITELETSLHLSLLFLLYALILAYLLLLKRSYPAIGFIILVAFIVLMVQVLLAVMQQIWLPALWPLFSFLISTLLLFSIAKLQHLKTTLVPNGPVKKKCKIETIRELVSRKDYSKAVILFRHCEFSEEMFELAYHLGQELEEQESWILARILYVWLAEYDPGMKDFVESMDHKINPMLNQDLSISDITENKDQFSHYQLVGKKAKGATATVYEAYDLYTHRRIALKILSRKLSEDVEEDITGDREVMSFLHEAMTISKLDHPNIVKIHDADIIDNQAYIAMDYVSGYPMSERLRRKKYITAAETLRILHSVLNALDFAHQKGIVHGDIKPANIMFDQHKKIYIITDFGAAQSASHLVDNEKRIMGTPAYMSPEQLSGSRIDGRSDLFSLAVTLYHLATGIQPFSGEKLSDLKKNVLNNKVDLDVLTLPDGVKQILGKALQKKTYQRFADASQMLHAVTYCENKLLKK